jgi:hypothetical protein
MIDYLLGLIVAQDQFLWERENQFNVKWSGRKKKAPIRGLVLAFYGKRFITGSFSGGTWKVPFYREF